MQLVIFTLSNLSEILKLSSVIWQDLSTRYSGDGVLFLGARTFDGSWKKSDLGFSGHSAGKNQSIALPTLNSDEARQRSIISTLYH